MAQKQSTTDVVYVASVKFLRDPIIFARMVDIIGNKPILLRITSSRIIAEIEKDIERWKPSLLRISGFISQVPELTEQLEKMLSSMQIGPDKIKEIRNGVDNTLFAPAEEKERKIKRQELFPDISDRNVVYIYTGRLGNSLKCVDYLIDQWIESGLYKNGYRLILTGDYARTDYGRKLHERYKSDKSILWSGPVDSNTVAGLLKASNVFVSASRNEGLSNSALEAMACGLPIIGRGSISGNSLLIIPEQTGYLFYEDRQLLAKVLPMLTDPKVRKNMGSQARELVINHFNIQQMVGQYNEVFSSFTQAN